MGQLLVGACLPQTLLMFTEAQLDSYLKDCWKWASEKSSLLRGAKLITQEIPAVTYCEDCHQTYGTVEHGKVCPFCLGGNTYLVAGNEFNIKEIEAC